MKRVTWWPQLFLGIAFNWGALLGWTAITNQLSLPAITLWAAGVFWTLGYDTIYAGQDMKDDQKIGIKSSILKLGGAARKFLYATYTVFFLLLGGAISLAAAKPLFALLLLPLLWVSTMRNIRKCQLDDPASCLAHFKSNNHLGFTVFLVLMVPAL
jgi:4-hydroxybenzoate polyprenyltransferase